MVDRIDSGSASQPRTTRSYSREYKARANSPGRGRLEATGMKPTTTRPVPSAWARACPATSPGSATTSSSSVSTTSLLAASAPARRARGRPRFSITTVLSRGSRAAMPASSSALPSVEPSTTTTISAAAGSDIRGPSTAGRRSRRLYVGITTDTAGAVLTGVPLGARRTFRGDRPLGDSSGDGKAANGRRLAA